MLKLNLEDTIAAISTPLGKSGIGIVRMSGKDALKIADKIFLSQDGTKPSEYPSFSIHYGHIVEDKKSLHKKFGIPTSREKIKNQKIIDEVLLTVMRAPRTYTKEDVVEINCHGGIVPLRKVLELVLEEGARLAQPGEFTLRAFLNGRIDLPQAEAVLDIVEAKTEKSLALACQQLRGELSHKFRKLKERILNIYAELEASIDFPEEDLDLHSQDFLLKEIEKVEREIDNLLEGFNKGLIFKEGISVAICGKPNVGKSSLMNLLLKRNRCLVSPFPGTTRDAIEEWVNIEGIPLRLIDTAGITEARNILEEEAIKRSQEYLKVAELVLFMLDGNQKISREDKDVFQIIKDKPKIIVINKIDLPTKFTSSEIKKIFSGKILKISCLTGEGLERLCQEMKQFVLKGEIGESEGYLVTNLRHKEALLRAKDFLERVKRGMQSKFPPELLTTDLKGVLENLKSLLGESLSEDVLEKIFSQFCIGK
ncbi:MAG: tRNA uridine-5-carboxymethylaminomethyl(34) synthesis GTPase MnmE [Candidatus Omnitrophica bacterium]|nr:tRNA uridine-5-carboxymethylaminomethyl(34) synthesis GTPase MnmE [Candidatus Omnitrophota bacterium]